jgi:hypothetical protein
MDFEWNGKPFRRWRLKDLKKAVPEELKPQLLRHNLLYNYELVDERAGYDCTQFVITRWRAEWHTLECHLDGAFTCKLPDEAAVLVPS